MKPMKNHAAIDIDHKDGIVDIQICLANTDMKYNAQHNFKGISINDVRYLVDQIRLSTKIKQALFNSLLILNNNLSIGTLSIEINLDKEKK